MLKKIFTMTAAATCKCYVNKKTHHMVLILLLLSTVIPIVALSESFPDSYDPHYLCSGVVDYDFYLPANTTFDDLNVLAISMMSPTWTFVNAECKSDMKRLTCSQVYLPSRNDSSEFPYRKPCKSLCVATSYLGSTCAGMMEGFGTAVDCTSDNFDQTDNLEQCNAMHFTAGALLVANDQEPYVGETCKGVLAAPIAIPVVDSAFAPYLPPYVAQSIAEGALSSWVGSMPVMAHDACLIDFRKMACGLMLPVAEVTHALDFIFGPLSLPSFPHLSVCTDFTSSCADTLRVVPDLAFNCSSRQGPIALFPNETQTITALNLGFGDILLQSSPNMMSNVTLQLETQCPYLLTVPEDPDGKYVNWIDGYNCALGCQLQVYPEDFTDAYFVFFKVTQWVSLFILTVALVNLQVLTSRAKRNPYLQLILSVLWLQACFTLMLVQNRTQEEVLCKDNAQSYSYEDSSSSGDALACTSAATFTLVHDNVLYFTFIAMTSELFCRVILQAKKVDYHKRFYVYGAGSCLVCLTLLQLFYPEAKNVTPVEGGWSLSCLWKYEDPMTDFWVFTFPKITMYTVCSAMSIFTAYRTMAVTRAVSGSFQKMWKSYRVLYVSLILFVGTFPVILFVDKSYYGVGQKDSFADANNDWFTCLISEFIGGNADYASTCGEVAKEHYPYALLYFMLAFYYVVTPLGNLWASFSKEAREKWSAVISKVRITIFSSLSGHKLEVKVVPVGPAPVVDNLKDRISPPSTQRDRVEESSASDDAEKSSSVQAFVRADSAEKYREAEVRNDEKA